MVCFGLNFKEQYLHFTKESFLALTKTCFHTSDHFSIIELDNMKYLTVRLLNCIYKLSLDYVTYKSVQ